jgi:hypothetical protein
MKKIVCSLVLLFCIGLSYGSFAQKSMAILTRASKQTVNERTAIVTFQLDNITTEQVKQKFTDSFKAMKGVQDVNATMLSDGLASFSMKMPKSDSGMLLQNMFAQAGIESVSVDGKIIAVQNLTEYLKEQKSKN